MARTHAPKVETLERERQILELRKAGVANSEVARQLDLSESRACQLYRQALHRMIREPAEDIIRLEVARLDALLRSMWTAAVVDRDLKAVDRVLRIMERRARLLGLDAPAKVTAEVTTYDGDSELDREIRSLVADLGRLGEGEDALGAAGSEAVAQADAGPLPSRS